MGACVVKIDRLVQNKCNTSPLCAGIIIFFFLHWSYDDFRSNLSVDVEDMQHQHFYWMCSGGAIYNNKELGQHWFK